MLPSKKLKNADKPGNSMTAPSCAINAGAVEKNLFPISQCFCTSIRGQFLKSLVRRTHQKRLRVLNA
jgi:hypothetical protein